LIGVIVKDEYKSEVEEFFELFKTPWEYYVCGHQYDVVVTTEDRLPEVAPRLTIVYSSHKLHIDDRLGIVTSEHYDAGDICFGDLIMPLYCGLLTFQLKDEAHACLQSTAGVAGLKCGRPGYNVIRIGYHLLEEIGFLLKAGQPVEQAEIPTLDIQIELLRNWIINSGIALLEIPPAPAGHPFIVCLTHDIDFVGIRNHKLDGSFWGFAYRASIGSLVKLFRGRTSLRRVFRNWLAVASVPLVYAGWLRDFWEPFEWYLDIERELPATYFLIPFRGRSGEKVTGRHSFRRAAAYAVDDLTESIHLLRCKGCEVGVHGIDAWHSVERGREELAKLVQVTGDRADGVRIHWLLRDRATPSVLEKCNFYYDSTVGYNETIGFRAGTTQVFRPIDVEKLLELPLHIQDGALFYPGRLNLSESQAMQRCQRIIDHALCRGGTLTVLWHDRSHSPERLWGDFYVRLVADLKSSGAWFATGRQAAEWFQMRRQVKFERAESVNTVRVRILGPAHASPPLTVRLHLPESSGESNSGDTHFTISDFEWHGEQGEPNRTLARTIASVFPEVDQCAV